MIRLNSWIKQANDLVKITDVLVSLGVSVPGNMAEGSNKKIYCPFGFYHSDGGITKAMRIYTKSNSAYCFSCSKSYSPVSLAAAASDKSWVAASLDLLEAAGFKAKSLEERWVEATQARKEKPDLIALAGALKMYCSAISPSWQTQQLDDIVADKLSQCLGLLDSVITDEDAEKWLQATKHAMLKTLEKQEKAL